MGWIKIIEFSSLTIFIFESIYLNFWMNKRNWNENSWNYLTIFQSDFLEMKKFYKIINDRRRRQGIFNYLIKVSPSNAKAIKAADRILSPHHHTIDIQPFQFNNNDIERMRQKKKKGQWKFKRGKLPTFPMRYVSKKKKKGCKKQCWMKSYISTSLSSALSSS